MNRRSARADRAAATEAAAADQGQADYFVRLLSQICRRTNIRIDMYQRGIAIADADGDSGYACAFRHLTRLEEHDRQALVVLIDHLQRRLSPPDTDEVSPIPRRARPVVR